LAITLTQFKPLKARKIINILTAFTVAADSKFSLNLGKSSQWQCLMAFRTFGVRLADIAFQLVERSVIRIAENFKIFRSIVELVMVNVMDMFVLRKFSAKHLFHNMPVLKHKLARDGDPLVSARVYVALTRAIGLLNQWVAISIIFISMGGTPNNARLSKPRKSGFVAPLNFTSFNRIFHCHGNYSNLTLSR
jgi:hypothetical protein